MPQELFDSGVLRTLRTNGERSMRGQGPHLPVMKVITTFGKSIWIISELDPSEPDHVYALGDMGPGPMVGWLSRDSMEQSYVQRGPFRYPLERDRNFAPLHTFDVYVQAARTAGFITEDPVLLDQAAAVLAKEQLARRK